jgi:hypothetical protein
MSFSISSFSGDINCSGNITSLMADHGGCTDTSGKRQMAFKTREPWMCARTEMGSSMLLAAKAAERSVNVYIADGNVGNTCSSIPKYTKVSYIILN